MAKHGADEFSHSLQVHAGPASEAINPFHELKPCTQSAPRNHDRLHVPEGQRDPVRIDGYSILFVLCFHLRSGGLPALRNNRAARVPDYGYVSTCLIRFNY
jgi:hypothetical protein